WAEFHRVSTPRLRAYRQPYEWIRLNRDPESQCRKSTNSWETDTEAAAAGTARLSQVHKRKVPRDSRQTAVPRCRAAAPETTRSDRRRYRQLLIQDPPICSLQT